MIQEETNRLLVELAQQGKRVVRLGRRPVHLWPGRRRAAGSRRRRHSVPGGAGRHGRCGATAYAGIPLTHRDHAQSVTFITGHCRPDGDGLDWADLARARQTLAIYMGTMKAADISQRLIAHGRAADTPVAVIVAARAPISRCRSARWINWNIWPNGALPALLVIGEVVELHHQIAWFGHQSQTEGRAPGRREFGIGKAFKDLLWTKTTHSFAAIGGGEYPYHP